MRCSCMLSSLTVNINSAKVLGDKMKYVGPRMDRTAEQICMKAKLWIHTSKWFRKEELAFCILLYPVIDTLWVEWSAIKISFPPSPRYCPHKPAQLKYFSILIGPSGPQPFGHDFTATFKDSLIVTLIRSVDITAAKFLVPALVIL